MVTTADKSSKHSQMRQQAAVPTSFVQKKEDTRFFGPKKQEARFFSPAFVQPKLTISQPNDPYEKEADHMAEKVMRMSEPSPVQPMQRTKDEELHRMEDESGEEGVMPMLEIAPVQRTHEASEEVQRKEEEGPDEELMTKAEPGLIQRSEDDEEEEVQAKLEPGNLSAPGIMRMEDDDAGDHEQAPEVQAMFHENIQRSETKEPEKKEHVGTGCDVCSGPKNINRKEQSHHAVPIPQRKDRGPPTVSTQFESSLRSSKGGGSPLSDNTRDSLENRFSADFSGVRIHTGDKAVQMNRDINAQAFTHGNDVYFNSGKYNPHTSGGGFLLAHELTHTIQQGASKRVQPKRLNSAVNSFVSKQTSLPPPAATLMTSIQRKTQGENAGDARPELVRAVAHARSQQGLVSADDKGPDGFRKGWEHLVDYFSTALGEDKVIKEGQHYRPGGVLINNIKKKTIIEAGKPKDTGGFKLQEVPGKADMVYRDAMPSWCGIFVYWALNKGGIPMPKWQLGVPAFDAASKYPDGYIPRVGDVAYRSAFSHFAIVEKSTGSGKNAMITTVNGNTAGENNMGGQVQVKDHPLSNWTFFFNPVYGKEGKLPENAVPVTADEIKKIIGQSDVSSLIVEKNEPVKFETNVKRLYGGVKVDKGAAKDEAEEKTDKAPVALVPGQQQKKTEGEKTEEAEVKPVAKAPATAAEDPAFKAVIGKSKKASVTQQKHGVNTEEAAAAQKAAVPPANDKLSKAQANQVAVMGAQKKGKFSPEQFKEKMKEKIKAAIPESEDEAKKFKEKNKLEDVEKNMQGDVQEEKKSASGAIEKATKDAPDTEGIPEKQVEPMTTTDTGKKPFVPNASAAAPKTKTNEEISMEEDANKLDSEMEKSDVSEDQLEKSNEPEFNSALKDKKESQDQARAGPQEYRAQEKPMLNKAENVAAATVDGKMAAMFGDRAKLLGNSDTIKSATKTKDEQKREEVANTLKGYYETTKTNVEKILGDLDTSVSKKFDEAAKKANKDFEDNVASRLDKYYTILNTISEFFNGLPKEVNDIFMDEKDKFIKAMDTVINEIAEEVSTKLNSAMDEIDNGKKKVEDYVGKLEPALQEYGRQAADDILGKFDELEQSVDDKQNDLTDKLAKQYADNVGKLQEKFDKIKSEAQGLLGAALGAIAAVIRTIKQLANMLFDVLAKVVHVVGKIIKDPINFLGNLVKAVGMGLTNFKDNIAEHLKKGFFEWLLGNMPPGIVFPKVWDLPGIFTFIMQIFGLSWANIRDRAVKKMGEPVVKALETTFEIFQIIIKEGLAGLWRFIEKQVGNLKTMVIDAIMNFLIESVVKAGITWVIGLLNPAGAFIKACKLIYDIIMFFVNNGRRIIELVNSIIDSVALIVEGNLGQASKMVENALARIIPIAIGFLASLLGLSGISEKVQKIIKTIQTPVNKAIDWVLDKAIALAKKLGLDKIVKKVKSGVKKAKDWGKKKVKDAKKWAKKKVKQAKKKIKKAKEKVKEGIAKFMSWLGVKQSFTGGDGQSHKLYFAGNENSPTLMVRSNPKAFSEFIALVDDSKNKKKAEAKTKAIPIAQKIDNKKQEPLDGDTKKKQEKSKAKKVKEVQALLKQLSKHTAILFGDAALAGEPEIKHPSQQNGFGKTMVAMRLNNKQKQTGSRPTNQPHAPFIMLNNRRQEGNPKVSYYVKGHLLNEKVGGIGDWKNLTPLSRDGNSIHETTVESLVKAAIQSGAVVEYNVTANYGYGGNASNIPTTDPKAKEKLDIIDAEKDVPTSLTCEAYILEQDDKGAWKRKTPIVKSPVPNVIGQSADSYALPGSMARPNIYLPSAGVSEIATIEGLDALIAGKIVFAHKKNKELRGLSQFHSYEALSVARKNNALDRVFVSASEQNKILALEGIKYVKLHEGSGDKSTGATSGGTSIT